jgi:hypothetical protein
MKSMMMANPAHVPSGTPADWIATMASRLAHLKDASVETVWEAIPPLFPEVYGAPCDRNDSYHIALASAVVRAVRGDMDDF